MPTDDRLGAELRFPFASAAENALQRQSKTFLGKDEVQRATDRGREHPAALSGLEPQTRRSRQPNPAFTSRVLVHAPQVWRPGITLRSSG